MLSVYLVMCFGLSIRYNNSTAHSIVQAVSCGLVEKEDLDASVCQLGRCRCNQLFVEGAGVTMNGTAGAIDDQEIHQPTHTLLLLLRFKIACKYIAYSNGNSLNFLFL